MYFLQLVIPPSRPGNPTTEYPMFVFCGGFSRDAQASPIHRPLSNDLEYSVDTGESDYIETEEFEIL